MVSNIGTWMQTVALGTLITLNTHSVLWNALVIGAAFIPMGLLSPLGGVLADRLDRRRWLIVTTIAEAVVAAGLTLFVAVGIDPPFLILIFAFLGGVAGAIGFPSYQSMLPDLVERDDLLAAVSLSSAQWNMGRVVGPALAAIVLFVWTPAVAFGINAVSFGAVVIALLFVKLPHRVRAKDGESVIGRLRDGAQIAFREPGCRSAIILITIVALVGSPFIGLVASFAIDGLHRHADGTAILTTAQGVGAVLGALALAPLAKEFGQKIVVSIALFAFCLAIVLYGLSPSIYLAALAMVLVGGTYICVLSGLNSVVQFRAPEAARGRVLSIFMMALGTIYPIGLILEGAIGQSVGIRGITIISGVTLAIILGGVALFDRKIFTSLFVQKTDRFIDASTPEVGEIDLAQDLQD